MMALKKPQAGMTFISLLALLALIGFSLMVIVKVLPAYMEIFKVDAALKNLTEKHDIGSASNKELKHFLMRKLQVDDVDSVTSNHIKIEKSKDVRMISIEYEYRVNIVGNIDIVVVIGNNAVEIRD